MHNESTSVMPFVAHDPAEKPLRVAEVAALLDVDPTTIYRAIKAGDLKAYRIGTGRGAVRVPIEAFAEYEAALFAAAVTAVAS